MAAKPDADGKKGAGQGFGELEIEPGMAAPGCHFARGKAEPAVGVLVAQFLPVVGQEIDHCNAPAGRQHPAGLGNRRLGIGGEMQHLVEQHQIGQAAFGSKYRIDLATECERLARASAHIRKIKLERGE